MSEPPVPDDEPRSEFPKELPTVRTPMALELRTTERAMAAVRAPQERRVLTIISGPNAGLVFALKREQHLLGRGELADLQVDEPDVSRVHAKFRRAADGNYLVEDARSTNGTFLGVTPVEQPVALKPGDRIQLGPQLVLRYSITDDIEQELMEQMHRSATRDPLTRLYNRRHLLERLASEFAHARRHGGPLSMLMIDVDGLKEVNAAHGHSAGDVLLRAVAGRLSRLVRQEDVVARFGGDEFAVLARSTALPAAVALAERLRSAMGDLRLPTVDERTVGTTLSFGVCALSELPTSAGPLELVTLADARLHRAKSEGRDRVCGTG
jgi:two-component system, cell cycle response regulator